MNKNNTKLRSLGVLLGMVLLTLAASFSLITPASADDFLYIGDGGDDSVKRFDARTGNYLGNFVAPGSGGLEGPRGMIFSKGSLLVVNQNVLEDFAGEILRYRNNGSFLNALVPCNPPLQRITCDPNAPFIPRGLIRGLGNTVLVADLFSIGANFQPPGHVKEINAKTGEFIRNFDTTGFTSPFFPRGIVRGPDGLIYVSVIGSLEPTDPNFDNLSGYILRFNPRTGKLVDTFVNNPAGNTGSGCTQHLHRPEGLVFGPDNKLYVTAFRANANDNDKVLVFNRNGSCVDQINLAPSESQVGANGRAFAQALLFGPEGRLFIPINGPVAGVSGPVTSIHAGEVRRYNVRTKTFSIFVPSAANGGSLQQPWYLTFGETNPSTLKYDH
jgi:DNA-binding beta-propeller fold protein YncE